jgi:uncharacterized protein (DUF736 family)
MPTIGHFTRATDGSFIGQIITLSVQAQEVRIIPIAAAKANVPTHRIMVGAAEIGAAWPAEGRTLHLALDDPSFAAPIEADLREEPDGRYSLVWLRNPPRGDG